MATTGCRFVDREAARDHDDGSSDEESEDEIPGTASQTFEDNRPLSQLTVSGPVPASPLRPLSPDIMTTLLPPSPLLNAASSSSHAPLLPRQTLSRPSPPKPAEQKDAVIPSSQPVDMVRPSHSSHKRTAGAAAGASPPSKKRTAVNQPPPPPVLTLSKPATEDDEEGWLAEAAAAADAVENARQQQVPPPAAAAAAELKHFDPAVHVFGFERPPDFQPMLKLASDLFKQFTHVEMLVDRDADTGGYRLLWTASDNVLIPHMCCLLDSKFVDHRSRTPVLQRLKTQWFTEVQDFNKTEENDTTDFLLTQDTIIVRNSKVFLDVPLDDLGHNSDGTVVSVTERTFEEEHLPFCVELTKSDVATMCSQIKRAEKVTLSFHDRKLEVHTENDQIKRRLYLTLRDAETLQQAVVASDWHDPVTRNGFRHQFSVKHFVPVEHAMRSAQRIRLGLQVRGPDMPAFAVFVFNWERFRVTIPLMPRTD